MSAAVAPAPTGETVTVCIATYRRLPRLALLLQDLQAQQRVPDEVVIIDNDAAASAQPVVEAARARGLPFSLVYRVQPEKNISITRNWTFDHASSDWLACIDDDERAPPEWIAGLLSAARRYDASIVLAPVIPVVPDDAPDWIRAGDFYSFPRMASGGEVPPNRLRFGNLLLRAAAVRATSVRFDPALGLTGGEDCDLLIRLRNQGLRIVWCDEAIVREPVEASRLQLGWLFKRALRGGQDFARSTWQGQYAPIGIGGRLHFLADTTVKLLASALLMVLEFPLGRHRAAKRLFQLAANSGKLSALCGAHYREYR